MKTPEEWIRLNGELYDYKGSPVPLYRFIRDIQLEAWKQGVTDVYEMFKGDSNVESGVESLLEHPPICMYK